MQVVREVSNVVENWLIQNNKLVTYLHVLKNVSFTGTVVGPLAETL